MPTASLGIRPAVCFSIRVRPRVAGCALATLLFVVAGSVQAAPRVVGGIDIRAAIAPWSANVRQTQPAKFTAECGGAIVDALHVLTAAHCVYGLDGKPAPPQTFSIRAGISNTYGPLSTDAEQDRSVVRVDVHPDYVWTSRSIAADDVAMLTLNKPLDLSGPDARAVALARSGAPLPVGAHVWLAGFGLHEIDIPSDGTLELINQTVISRAACQSAAARFTLEGDDAALCARAPHTATCRGDSGSGLVAVSRPRVLVGIVSAGSDKCVPGSVGLFTYVGTPVIHRFIASVLRH
jgi:trypsin